MLKFVCLALVALTCLGSATAGGYNSESSSYAASTYEFCPAGWFTGNGLCYKRSGYESTDSYGYGNYGSGAGSYGGNNYDYTASKNTWAKALKDCEYKGASLIYGLNDTTLRNLRFAPFDGTFWIGLTLKPDGKYHWLEESGFDTTIQPSWFKQSESLSTGCVTYNVVDGFLRVVNCDAPAQYWYCQREQNAKPSYYNSESSYNGGSYNTYSNNYNGGYNSGKYQASSYNSESYKPSYNSESSYNKYNSESSYNKYNSESSYNKPSSYNSESSYNKYNSESSYRPSSSYNSERSPSYNKYNSESSSYNRPSSYNSESSYNKYNSESYKPSYNSESSYNKYNSESSYRPSSYNSESSYNRESYNNNYYKPVSNYHSYNPYNSPYYNPENDFKGYNGGNSYNGNSYESNSYESNGYNSESRRY